MNGRRKGATVSSPPPYKPQQTKRNLDLLHDLWQAKNYRPNAAQEEAILYTGENSLLITAAPGSGKTSVLLWRALNLILSHDIKPEEIYLGTFTEKAAFQLKEGLKSLLALAANKTNQHHDISRMYLGTIHSNCHRILCDRHFSPNRQRRHPPSLFDATDQYFHIYQKRFWSEMVVEGGFDDEWAAQQEINAFFGKKSSSRHQAVKNCIAFFNRLSEEAAELPTRYRREPIVEQLLKMYAYYLDSLKGGKAKFTDLSLLQQAALKVVGASDAPIPFKHVIIDEYQDTNTVQEKLFFAMAGKGAHLAVVGDDDQALYRFRGATVENLVDFRKRCVDCLDRDVHEVNLGINYRSPKDIVVFYSDFINEIDWSREDSPGEYYRIANKEISAYKKTKDPSIAILEGIVSDGAWDQLVNFIVKLKKKGKIHDYNQVAFLFPYLQGNERVDELKTAFEAKGVKVYAPRAGRFLDIEEARAVFGLLMAIFGTPSFTEDVYGYDATNFRNWIRGCEELAEDIQKRDQGLSAFIRDKKDEIEQSLGDYDLLSEAVRRQGWNPEQELQILHRRKLSQTTGISEKARRSLQGKYFEIYMDRRRREGRPVSVAYAVKRATSLDWNLLDLFYQFCTFDHFKTMFDLAERGTDEGPLCNMGLISQYLSRYMEKFGQVFTAPLLVDKRFLRSFFMSYCFSCYRLQESEYEDADDPFPKGRIPFLTIHQAKGLEFPVVVLGSLCRKRRKPPQMESLVRQLLKKEGGEPLDKINLFDNMRLFYVALSRAANLLIIPKVKRQKLSMLPEFKKILERPLTPLAEFPINSLPEPCPPEDPLGKSYSYTADYLFYKRCPRSYMFYRKYGFAANRSLTMSFGTLVHRTIEDLHSYLIFARGKSES